MNEDDNKLGSEQPMAPMAEATPSMQPTDTTKPQTEMPKPKASRKPMLALVAAVALLVVAGGAYALTSKKDTDKKETVVKAVVKKEIPVLRSVNIDGDFTATLFPPALPNANPIILVRSQMFNSLVTTADKKDIVPQLATSWTNPDTSTWIFKLQSGVKFHNGNAFTAKAAKESIEAAMALSDYEPFASTIKSIEATDSLTLKITTKQPDAALLSKMTFFSIYDTSAKVIDDQTGTGPYIIKIGTKPDAKKVTLTAISDYFEGKVYTKELEFTSESDTEKIVADMTSGKIDMGESLDLATIAKIKAAVPASTVIDNEAIGAYGMYLNSVKPGPLQKLAVRQAIYKALDISKVIKAGGAPGKVPTQFVASSIPGYNPDIKLPVQDIEGAKKLLTDAGITNGITISLVAPKSGTALAQELKAQLAVIGVTVNLSEAVLSSYINDVNAGKFESWLLAYTSDINDASDVISSVYQGVVYKNFYNTPAKLNEVMVKANTTFDQKQRLQYLQQAVKIISDDIPFIPLRNRTYQYILTKPYEIKADKNLAGVLGANYWKVYEK